MAYWFAPLKQVFVFEDEGVISGTYYIGPNSAGPADHICNCGYAVHPGARGRGIATQMAQHSYTAAKTLGYRGMQYNLVVATNMAAVRLWQKLGMKLIGTVPGVFRHAQLGEVDAHIMFKTL